MAVDRATDGVVAVLGLGLAFLKFLGGAAPADDRVWWTPSEGVHEIYVADTAGLFARRKLEVRTRIGYYATRRRADAGASPGPSQP